MKNFIIALSFLLSACSQNPISTATPIVKLSGIELGKPFSSDGFHDGGDVWIKLEPQSNYGDSENGTILKVYTYPEDNIVHRVTWLKGFKNNIDCNKAYAETLKSISEEYQIEGHIDLSKVINNERVLSVKSLCNVDMILTGDIFHHAVKVEIYTNSSL